MWEFNSKNVEIPFHFMTGTSGSYACEYYEGFGKDMYFKAGLGVNLFAGGRF